jgi:RND family efflux transporter MFP subunit
VTITAGSVPLHAQQHGETLRGIVRAVNEAMIGTDLIFPIASLPFREGQSFAKGDILVAFDCSDLEAQVKSAEAVLRAETITHENNARLARSKAVGTFEVALSGAKKDQAAAELEAYQSKMSRCVVRAPYDGRIAFMRAHEHETPEPNQPMMQIVSEGDLEIETLLPSSWLKWLKPGTPFGITIDETGEKRQAQVSRIAAIVDPVSQTVKVTGRFTGDTKGILPGMSGPTEFSPASGG